MTQLHEHYFGDLEAFDEAELNRDFFKDTFVTPNSMSTASLKNRKKFIIVGRKGVGKTAVQMRLADQAIDDGYFATHFRFFYDMRGDDYSILSKTQSGISLVSATNNRNLFLHYDFRDVWQRVFFNKIAEHLIEKGVNNKFTKFVVPNNSPIKNIFEGITKTLTVNLTATTGSLAAEVGFDFSKLTDKKEVSLKDFNSISRQLFRRECSEYQMYFFIDELVFSRLEAREDEITIRAAMVRDIIRTAWELNSFCAKEDLAFHFICSIRPEIRNLINDLDGEAGKLIDGKDVELTWFSSGSNDDTLIMDVLKKKIEFSSHTKCDFETFFTKKINFGNRAINISDFLKTNTWGRPRDIVRLLIAIQKKSPNKERIDQEAVKAGLDEYSRMSTKEIIDELGVGYGANILSGIKRSISKRFYEDENSFWDALSQNIRNVDRGKLMAELFELGFIGGRAKGTKNYYWAHRGETYLKSHHQIVIHQALWNEFSIRGS